MSSDQVDRINKDVKAPLSEPEEVETQLSTCQGWKSWFENDISNSLFGNFVVGPWFAGTELSTDTDTQSSETTLNDVTQLIVGVRKIEETNQYQLLLLRVIDNDNVPTLQTTAQTTAMINLPCVDSADIVYFMVDASKIVTLKDFEKQYRRTRNVRIVNNAFRKPVLAAISERASQMSQYRFEEQAAIAVEEIKRADQAFHDKWNNAPEATKEEIIEAFSEEPSEPLVGESEYSEAFIPEQVLFEPWISDPVTDAFISMV